MADFNDIRDKFLGEFSRLTHLHANGLGALRDTAIRNFEKLGFPTTKNEEWKYTNVAPLLNPAYSLPAGAPVTRKADVLKRMGWPEHMRIAVLENGRFLPGESNMPGGFTVGSLYENREHPVVKQHFARYADMQTDSFAALNTAFFQEGLFIHIAESVDVAEPLMVVNISSQREDAVLAHQRLLVVAGRHSSAKVSFTTLSASDNSLTFVNAVNEIVTGENASLEFDLFQDENNRAYQVCNTHVYQERSSRFTINTVTLGGSIVRNTLHLELAGENCETHLYGLYVAGGSQLVDNHTSVRHALPHSNSNQLYKGIIGGKAHGVFNGKIFVAKDAQKTNAYQSNKNILLGNDAVVNAKPQLEIFADDVKCTHGATTGQMDDDALFYLRARGINIVQAKALLNKAFASDILDNITIEPLRDAITRATEEKLIAAHAS